MKKKIKVSKKRKKNINKRFSKKKGGTSGPPGIDMGYPILPDKKYNHTKLPTTQVESITPLQLHNRISKQRFLNLPCNIIILIAPYLKKYKSWVIEYFDSIYEEVTVKWPDIKPLLGITFSGEKEGLLVNKIHKEALSSGVPDLSQMVLKKISQSGGLEFTFDKDYSNEDNYKSAIDNIKQFRDNKISGKVPGDLLFTFKPMEGKCSKEEIKELGKIIKNIDNEKYTSFFNRLGALWSYTNCAWIDQDKNMNKFIKCILNNVIDDEKLKEKLLSLKKNNMDQYTLIVDCIVRELNLSSELDESDRDKYFANTYKKVEETAKNILSKHITNTKNK